MIRFVHRVGTRAAFTLLVGLAGGAHASAGEPVGVPVVPQAGYVDPQYAAATTNGVSPVQYSGGVDPHYASGPLGEPTGESCGSSCGSPGFFSGHHGGQGKGSFCVPAIVPAPLGTFNRNVFQMHADLAKAERLVIYQEEWYTGTAKPKGCSFPHLETIAAWILNGRMPHSTFPVRVEPIGDPILDQARRMEIVNFLASRGIADAEQRVLIYPPSAEGLRWESIERLFQRGFGITTGGAGQGTAGGGGGGVGFGTTGFSGGSTFVPAAVGGTFRSPF